MKTLLILGAGTGGTLLANRLARRLDGRDWQIVIVDRDERHVYQPGLFFIPFGQYTEADVLKPRRRLLSKRVKVLFGEVELIEPAANRVKLAGQREPITYDQLVIALGCDIDPAETPGLKDGGWRKNIFDFYTLEGAKALAEYLKSWRGGRLVVNVVEMPIKCPVAALEFLFLADWFFRKRHLRSKVELILATPMSGAFTKPKAAAALGGLLQKKGIDVVPDFAVSDVDPVRGKLISYDNKEVCYDLLVSIPVNKGAEVIGRSGMGDELNYVETNRQTLQAKHWPNVWVIGDAGDVPTAKAVSVAHYMGEVLLENLCHTIRGQPPPQQFDGHANCFIESGAGRALLIDYNYTDEPQPGRYPSAVWGPLPLLKESILNHWYNKLGSRWLYWHALLPGRLPLPARHQPPR